MDDPMIEEIKLGVQHRDDLIDMARSISFTAAGAMVPPRVDVTKLEPRYERTYNHRTIVHTCTFNQPISRIDFEKYVEHKHWFGFHPCGYGGGSYPLGRDENEMRTERRWENWDSSD